jgi:outer membrane protein OmpA-like peptidoglycan-associated protein
MKPNLRLCLLLLLCTAISANAAERPNILGIASGAVLLSSTGEYSGGWMALNLFDGTTQRGWCSPANKPLQQAFVVELPQRYQLKSIVLDNTGAQEGGYPGISARSVELWASNVSADSGYRKIATLEAAQGARKEFALPAGTEANWLKLVVVSNWGHKQYTELMEVEAYGAATGPAPERAPLSGVYDTNYGPLQLTRDGNRITGCYYGGNGQIAGATDGRTINVEWRQGDGSTHGTALMTLSARGDFLNGVWYQNGVLEGSWFGTRNAKSGKVCDDASHNTLSQQLKQSGRAILYGIHFDSDSADLRPDSTPALQQVVALLTAQSSLKLNIEGHTDSTNSDAYNLDLSRRRAQAVVEWLSKNGVAASRLSAHGYGSSRPVADNTTPQGRALNRRVEIVAQN